MRYSENLLIGADPEVFVKRNGVFVSGHTFPLGTKEQPTVIASGAIQNDGLALEFNVIPSRTRVEFVGNCVRVYKDLEDIVKVQDATATLSPTPTVYFGKDVLAALPKNVAALGCNPDYNAYTREPNPTPNAEYPFRTGSGHVHVGFTEGANVDTRDHMLDCCDIAAQLDYFLGLPSLLWDNDNQRRSLYGKAGAFRPKTYGMEYRVLSNMWLTSEALMGFVYDRTVQAMEFLDNGDNFAEEYGMLAREIIDNNDVDWPEKYPFLEDLAYAA